MIARYEQDHVKFTNEYVGWTRLVEEMPEMASFYTHTFEKEAGLSDERKDEYRNAMRYRKKRMSLDLQDPERFEEMRLESGEARTFIRTWVRFLPKDRPK